MSSFVEYGFHEPKDFEGDILGLVDEIYFGWVARNGHKEPKSWDIDGKELNSKSTFPLFCNLKQIWYRHIPPSGILCFMIIDNIKTNNVVRVNFYEKGMVKAYIPKVKEINNEIYKVEEHLINVESLIPVSTDYRLIFS